MSPHVCARGRSRALRLVRGRSWALGVLVTALSACGSPTEIETCYAEVQILPGYEAQEVARLTALAEERGRNIWVSADSSRVLMEGCDWEEGELTFPVIALLTF